MDFYGYVFSLYQQFIEWFQGKSYILSSPTQQPFHSTPSCYPPPLVHTNKLSFVAETNLPTIRGNFRVRSYRLTTNLSTIEPLAIIFGEVEGKSNVPLRVHDQCFTSEVLGSMKCDCQEQLSFSLEYIKSHSPGIVIYLQQEGRGIGLANKIAAYSLQENGFDTVEANRRLGLPDDSRNYDVVYDILQDLKIQSVQLLTNNPRKIDLLTQLGIQITQRIPIVMVPNSTNLGYLQTKALKMNHLLDFSTS